MKYDPRIAQYPLSREQQVFAATWFNMAYAYSLDSHRVRVMHGVNILEELMQLCVLDHASGEDRSMVAREALTILEREAVLKRPTLQAPTTRVCELLKTIFAEKYDKALFEKKRVLLDAYLREYLALLHGSYVDEISHGLHAALFAPDTRPEEVRFDEIRSLTGSLLSYLIARGQSIEGLFQLYHQSLVRSPKPTKTYVFASRFDFLRRLITSEDRSWRVVFAVDGVTDVANFPSHIGNITFDAKLDPILAAHSSMSEQGNRVFATGEVKAIDGRAAGQILHERINRVLDLVRFEYERGNILLAERFAVTLQTLANWRILPIPKVVPNPQSSITPTELNLFAQNVSTLVTGDRFSKEGRERVLSAFRLYRAGADTTSFENKLVNWWTGLEFLAKGMGSGAIGLVVVDTVTPVLMGVSLINHLSAYREMLLEQSVNLRDPDTQQPIVLKDLDFAQLYDVLGQATHRPLINNHLVKHPLSQTRFERFSKDLASPAAMATFLSRSEQGLRWHLHRIYRARCDIVHSAGRRVNIALLCANLEAYLKSVLTAQLAAFGRIPTLSSPEEFFVRANESYTRARGALGNAKSADAIALKSFLLELRPHRA